MAKKKTKKKKKASVWAKNKSALAAALELKSRKNIYPWLKKVGFPQPTKKGWNIPKCIKFMRSSKQTAARTIQGADADLKRLKIQLQCDVLEAKSNRLRGSIISIEEYKSDLSEYAALVNSVFERWIQEVAAITRNVRLLKKAKQLRDQARKHLADGIAKL